MLDNTVAGGMATGENPLLCISREAEEEASLPMEYVKEHAEAAGAVSYIYLRSALATGETGLVQPEVQYIFDLELPGDMVPKPNDSEVECFYLWTVEEVHEHLAKGRFKPNCALVLLDFFIRRGILTPDNEPNFEEIKRRVHRPLPFPGPHRKDQQS
jgi:8-oxo-dGTP pyrophosphatase MutT (NUDIX family)